MSILNIINTALETLMKVPEYMFKILVMIFEYLATLPDFVKIIFYIIMGFFIAIILVLFYKYRNEYKKVWY